MRRKPSLVQHVWFICIGVFLFFFGASYIYYSVVVSQRLSNITKTNIDVIANQLAENVTGNMNMLKETAYFLMSNNQTQLVMEDVNASPLDVSRMADQIDSALTFNVAWSERVINSLYLFREDGTTYSALRESVYAGVRSRHQAVYAQYQDFSNTKTLVRPQGSIYCYYLHDYYQIDTQKKVGKLIIEVEPENFVGAHDVFTGYSDNVIFLTSSDGSILYCSRESSTSLSELSAYYEKCRNERQYFALTYPVNRFQLQLHIFINQHEMMEPVNYARNSFLLTEGVVLLTLLILGYFVRKKLAIGLNSLIDKCTALSDGQFSVRLLPSRYREIDAISVSFNRMADQLGKLFQQVSEAGTLLNHAEYQMLESQIDPHFIMNILETINMSCRMAGQSEISEMILNLGMLLQSNVIMKKRQKITLRQELDYVRYYLALQQRRFSHLQYEIELEDDSLLDIALPKLTIQPIVENSIIHGLEDSMHPGMISIHVWEEADELLIRIQDNGKGFDTSKLDLHGSDQKWTTGGNHVALKNIARRIELLYGEKSSFHVTSIPGQGTEVLIVLPMSTESGEGGIPCLK